MYIGSGYERRQKAGKKPNTNKREYEKTVALV